MVLCYQRLKKIIKIIILSFMAVYQEMKQVNSSMEAKFIVVPECYEVFL